MAMKSQYYSVNGRVRAESNSTGFRSYFRDNLGSVVKTISNTATVVHSYVYKPFGEVMQNSGMGAMQRRFLWCGSWGYGHTNLHDKWNSYYVRSRHYSGVQGLWTTVDPIWPRDKAYRYVRNSVTKAIDPSGLEAASAAIGGFAWAGAAASGTGAAAGGTGAVAVGTGAVAVGGATVAGAVIVSAGAGAAVGLGLDHLTDGGWGKFWCKWFPLDCEGLDYLPADPWPHAPRVPKVVPIPCDPTTDATPEEREEAERELGKPYNPPDIDQEQEKERRDRERDIDCVEIAQTFCAPWLLTSDYLHCYEVAHALCLKYGSSDPGWGWGTEITF